MVSFHEALAESPRAKVHSEFGASSNKRKWEEPFVKEFFNDQTNLEKRKSTFDIELNLDTPFTSDKWRQYLSIQDSKRSPEPPLLDHMSLDLELNLTSESYISEKQRSSGSPVSLDDDLIIESSKCKKDSDHGLIHSSPSWLSSEGDYKEMVATVCMRCHMLVMLCKSSPECPNCKFMHPPDQNPSKFLKRRCSLLC